VIEVLREQRRELAHARELFVVVCVHTWWCCARPCRRRSQRARRRKRGRCDAVDR
jgi:hypothetical protein